MTPALVMKTMMTAMGKYLSESVRRRTGAVDARVCM